MKSRILAILLVVALLVVAAVFSVQAADPLTAAQANEIIAAVKSDLDKNDEFDSETPSAVTAVCPYCDGEAVTWQPLPAITDATIGLTGTHYYLAAGVTYNETTGNYYKHDTNVVTCLYLNGNNITDGGSRVFWISAGTVNIMGTGTIQGKGTYSATETDNRGAALDISGGTVNIFGGTYLNSIAVPIIMMRGGNSIQVNMYGGVVGDGTKEASSVNFMTTAVKSEFNLVGGTINGGYITGGSVYMRASGSDFNMSGGEITNSTTGTAKNGMNVRLNEGSEFNMSAGTISLGQNTKGASGGNFAVYSATLNVSGTASITGGSATTGGNIYAEGVSTVSISGGSITNGVATGNAGNIYIKGTDADALATLSISGTAQITGGQSAGSVGGGGVYLGTYVDATMTGGTVSGNKSTNESASAGGGNFVVSADSTLTVSGTAQIKNGESATCGGNISARASGAEVTIEGGNISGGTASGTGGSIYVKDGTIDITGGKIGVDKDGDAAGGTSSGNGGNLYLDGTADAEISGNAVIANGNANTTGSKTSGGNIAVGGSASLTIKADANDKVPTIENGSASNMGGNIYLAGELEMTAGNLKGGTATIYGGSVGVYGGTATISGGEVDGDPNVTNTPGNGGLFYLGNGAELTINGTAVLKNGHVSEFGGAVYVAGGTTVTVGGKAQVNENCNQGCIYVGANGNFTVDAGFGGRVNVWGQFPDGTTYGDQVQSSGTGVYSCTGEYTGTVRLLQITGACAIGQYDTENSIGTLWVAGVALCKDGVVVDGALTTADAVDKFASGDYDFIRSYTEDTTFELTDKTVTYVIDLDGKDITVNAKDGVTGITFKGLDTEASTSAATGAKATLGEGVINGLQYKDNDEDGTIYIGLQPKDSNTVTYHALKMDITGVSLRTTTGGIYYWASVNCDDTLAKNIESFGIIFGINESAPTSTGEEGVLYSEITEGILTDGTEMTGAIMNGILVADRNDGKTNDTTGAMKIWGVPYVNITYIDADGFEQTAEILAGEAQSAHMSIYDVVSKLDAYIGTLKDTDPNKEKYLHLLTEKFNWVGYAFTSEIDDWAAVKTSLVEKKAALNTETAE